MTRLAVVRDRFVLLVLFHRFSLLRGDSIVIVSFSQDDFQRDKNGKIDYSLTEPKFVELWCLSCRHYDGESSPNGGRRDICVDKSQKLIDLSTLKIPTLIICGDKDPYLNYKLLDSAQTLLPEGSSVKIIKGGSHDVFVEKPYHKEFQKLLLRFLKG